MNESLISFLWMFRLFSAYVTKTGETFNVIKPGNLNVDSGPDFFDARIKIGDTLWAGNVEIHNKTSDWYKHGHQYDEAYDNIILHIVYDDDISDNKSNHLIFEIKDKFPIEYLEKYEYLMKNKLWVPCAKLVDKKFQDKILLDSWLERLLIEKMEQKSNYINSVLLANNNSFEETFYQMLARNFGFSVNAIPFEMLAKSLPLRILAKQKDNFLQIEALLFGQAGMLENDINDIYYQQLKSEYAFLKKKFILFPIRLHLWKFHRIRPHSFPSTRIAQFAALIHYSKSLFASLMECNTKEDIYNYFNINTSSYWLKHFVFGEETKPRKTEFTRIMIDLLIINTIVPFMFVYANFKDDEELKNRAFDILESIDAESNSIVKGWKSLSFKIDNAYKSQAFIHLKNNYCNQKQCLRCRIGDKIMRNI